MNTTITREELVIVGLQVVAISLAAISVIGAVVFLVSRSMIYF